MTSRPSTRVEVRIYSYFSLEADLAAEMNRWPEFISGSGHTVKLATPDGTESVSATPGEDFDELPYVRISGSTAGPLFDRVVGRVIYTLAAHSDTLVVKRLEPNA